MTRKSVSTINIESLVAKENNYSNPYVAISSTMASNLGASIINIIDFISENTKEDINENFFYRTSSFDYGQEVIAQGNLFSILSEADFNSYVDWDTGFPQKLFNKLYDLGAIFSNGTKNYVFPNRDALSTVSDIKTGTSDIRKTNKIFENVHNEKKAICLLGFAYKQMSQENFTNEVQKAKTLHQAVQFNNINLIKFLIEDCKISPNLKDEKNLTPIFSARRLESLELLSKYETDWFHLNAEGKDCLSVYISSSIDKSISVKMVDFVQKQMKMSIKHGEKSDLGENYIEERIKLNLLDMVTSDKTKKDLQDFIKKNEIKDISKIADEKGNNLAIICLKNQNWARYNMFKDDCGIDSENNFGTSPLEIMLSKKYIKRENDATKVLDELFSKKVYKKNIKFSFNMIKRAIYKNENISLPTWYFRSSNKSQIIKLFKDIAEGNYDLIDDFSKRCEEAYKNSGFGYRYGNDSAINSISIMLLLTHATLFNKDFNLGDINIKKVFTMESSWINKEVQYMKTNKEAFKNTLEIIEFCEQQTIFKKINCDKLKENLENIATSTILLSLSNIRKYKNERKGEIGNNSDDMFMYFISENEVAIKYLIDIKSKVFSEIVDEEMIKDIESITNKRDGFSEIERGLKYLFINRSVDQQDNQEKTKSKKLKI